MDHETAVIDPAPVFAPTFQPRARRRRGATVGWIIAVMVVLALGAAGAFVHVAAHRAFDAAAAALNVAIAEAQDAADLLGRVADGAADSVAAAEEIIAAASDDLVDVDARTRFDEAAEASAGAVQSAEDLLSEPASVPATDKPFWTWELWRAVPRFEAGAAGLADLEETLRDAGGEVDDADAELADAAEALYASVAPAADALETVNVSARNVAVLDFRDAGEAVANQRLLGPGAVQAFRTYAESAASLKSSAQAELAEKAGPLLATRLEIEAFARSMSGGVVLDFDWAPIVNGRGGYEWMSGNATWHSGRGGYSTITLSDSVAQRWPTADAKALVAHEVGHAITAKCSEMFDSGDKASNEAWATAWAISMGHTAEGNGTQAYGYPPSELIATAASCR